MIYNGIDVDRYRYDPARRERMRRDLGISGFCVMHVGAFSAVKNQGYLVRAFSVFHGTHPDSVLLLVGQGELMDDARKEAEALGLGGEVRFLGQRNDVADIMQAADLLVLPSLHEGLPFVAVEAQAAGLPCILTDRAAAEAKILETCSFFDIAQPPEALAAAMEEKMGLPREDTADRLRKAGFDLKTCARKLEEDLAEML
jgi:glycosyltransferase involved in cell wall biosynthesis